jgi:hypothetical protein
MVWDEARLSQGHDEQSRRGHQCSETTLTGESRFHISPPKGFEPTGESRFHISPPKGFEPESLVAGSKQAVHWTSETW